MEGASQHRRERFYSTFTTEKQRKIKEQTIFSKLLFLKNKRTYTK